MPYNNFSIAGNLHLVLLLKYTALRLSPPESVSETGTLERLISLAIPFSHMNSIPLLDVLMFSDLLSPQQL